MDDLENNCYLCFELAGSSKLMKCGHPVHLKCLTSYIISARDVRCGLCGLLIQAVDISKVKHQISKEGPLTREHWTFFREVINYALFYYLTETDLDESHLR